jgi:hypothetical protein
MALDPRLRSVELLTLAAMRAKQRSQAEPRHRVVLQIEYYDARGIDPPTQGEWYTYELPAPGDRSC